MNEILQLLITKDVLYIILAIVATILSFGLYSLHRDKNSNIDLTDLITSEGKLSERKIIRFFTWLVSTWGFIYMITTQHLTEWYFVGYIGVWVCNALIGKKLEGSTTNE